MRSVEVEYRDGQDTNFYFGYCGDVIVDPFTADDGRRVRLPINFMKLIVSVFWCIRVEVADHVAFLGDVATAAPGGESASMPWGPRRIHCTL